MQYTALLLAQERLLAGDAQQFRLNTRPAIRETGKLRFHAFQVPFQRRGWGCHRLLVRLGASDPGEKFLLMRLGIAVPMFVAASVCPRLCLCLCLHLRQRDGGTCMSDCVRVRCVYGCVRLCVCVGVCVCDRVCSNVSCHHTRKKCVRQKYLKSKLKTTI